MIFAQSVVLIFLSAYSGLDAPGIGNALEAPLKASQVDVMDRIFPDAAPEPMKYKEPIHVPRGGNAAFQFAVTAGKSGLCEMSVGSIRRSDGNELACSKKLFHLRYEQQTRCFY